MVRTSRFIKSLTLSTDIYRALGTSDNSQTANLEYPLAFQDSIIKVLEPRTGKAPFRFIFLSGKLVEQDQNRSLWFLPIPRKTKACKIMPLPAGSNMNSQGRTEVRSIEFAKTHSSIWHSFVVRPGGVYSNASFATGILTAITGDGWFIGGDELGAFMADLAIKGEEEETVILNPRLVAKGKELLLEGK
jgi:hypothetical protein